MIEGKRVYTVKKVSLVMNDIERISSFRPIQHGEVSDRLAPRHRFGVLVATTWSSRMKNWWTGEDQQAWGSASALWARTRSRAIKVADSGNWGAIPLKTQSADGTLARHHLLYAVWRL